MGRSRKILRWHRFIYLETTVIGLENYQTSLKITKLPRNLV